MLSLLLLFPLVDGLLSGIEFKLTEFSNAYNIKINFTPFSHENENDKS